ncbi:MAG: anaerobic ribonucleoside triphosphate reductase [Candidatus Saccharibacteria bacterium]|nr:anaerobic ribonucleoside triphosphate reductase [Candidatus Saccharibacteria bacterium]
MLKSVQKRDGRIVDFNLANITSAIIRAGLETHEFDKAEAAELAAKVEAKLEKQFKSDVPTVEQIQDLVEDILMKSSYKHTAKAYIIYREDRSKVRNSKTRLMKQYKIITGAMARESSDLKRSNANVDGDTAMGKMLQFGEEGSKEFAKTFLLKPQHAQAHDDGDIHIHDLDFYATGTLTCCQTDPLVLFADGGFSTGHGFLRTPQSIGSYAALTAIILQANQNEQHGGQAIPNFDWAMAPGVEKTYRKCVKKYIQSYEEFTGEKVKYNQDDLDNLIYDGAIKGVPAKIFKLAREETKHLTYQAMESLVHNLNTMHSRAGAQVPFTSINFGTDTSPAGRLVSEQFLLATEAGLGHHETPIFPISIFKVKEGINFNPEDPNYDLYKLSMRVSSKRLFPNFTFIDAPFNLKKYVPGDYHSEVATMGCRTRVFDSIFPESDGTSVRRGNLSFTSINLSRLAIKHGIALGERKKADWSGFYKELDDLMDVVADQLYERYKFQGSKVVRNFPFLMGQGNWMGSEKLGPDDELQEVIKHGSLSIGFIGLAETLVAMIGKHHGESDEAQKIGLEIIGHMRDKCDEYKDKYHLNYSLFATPAESLSGRFVKIDRKKYGVIKGVTDREFYTNSFHVPVYYKIGAFDKVDKEAPYHALCNAGHITYVELDGDPSQNIEAFEAVIRHMKEAGVGYGSINHPVDRDPVCGFSGIIEGDCCPSCRRMECDGPSFERLRRITGYLVGTLDRWNDAKRAEEKARVKHNVTVNQNGVYTTVEKSERELQKIAQAKAIGKE